VREPLRRWCVLEDQDDDLREHLLTACVLLLLQERAATSAQLHSALGALRLLEDPAMLPRTLEAMEDSGLVFSTWGAGATVPRRHTFHVAPAGSEWLSRAAGELRRSEGFLGAFVARCGERLV
jgi:DNA-binding PadR family transcriptional regulator